ncbi:MAG: dihydrolipoyl dehydrogenase [Hyphomicrobium sp.]|nr:dihydrolipoyl dehydrogenase [Hyphomicrobium sp.]
MDFDVLIIGSGPGGYVAAIRAAQLGFKTAIVEREYLGGVCLNWGCIPSKALLRSAEILKHNRMAQEFGLQAAPANPELAQIVGRSRDVSKRLNAGVDYLMTKNNIRIIWGEASIERAPSDTPGEVIVRKPDIPPRQPQIQPPKGTLGEGRYTAKHIIIATGARPRVIPGVTPDGDRVWTYFEAMVPRALPRSIIVIGSGAIGVEFASFYRALGVEVTLVEALSRILPMEDAEIAQIARRSFQKDGIRILTGTKVLEAAPTSQDGISLTIESAAGDRSALQAERLILAVGVTPNTEGLNLERLGVELECGSKHIKVDGAGRTSVPGIYAIGDVAGAPMLAHKAEHQGVACVEAIKEMPARSLDIAKIPSCIFCSPQIASVGLTEEKAKAAGHDVLVGRFPFRANGKAIAVGETEGLVKTIFDRSTQRLLGAQLIGNEVTELIGTFALALETSATLDSFRHTVFPHPTLSEAIFESALSANMAALHI